MTLQHWIQPVLGIFANRLALEIERKSAEDELKLAASVFNENVEAIMIADRDTNILRVNPAFCRITGYSADEIIGQANQPAEIGPPGQGILCRFLAVTDG